MKKLKMKKIWLGTLVFLVGVFVQAGFVGAQGQPSQGANSNEDVKNESPGGAGREDSSEVMPFPGPGNAQNNAPSEEADTEKPGNRPEDAGGNANERGDQNRGEGQEMQIQVQENNPGNSGNSGNPGEAGVGEMNKTRAIQSAQETIQEKLSQTQGNKGQMHRQIAQEVGKKLEQAGNQESEPMQNRMEQIAQKHVQYGEQVAEKIEKAEQRKGFQKFLLGEDYKNLGELRSTLSRNKAQMEELVRALEEMESQEGKEIVKEQLVVLMKEREEIKNFIREKENSGFSLLGWMFKLNSDYSEDGVDESEEQQLESEVEEVLQSDVDNQAEEEEEEDEEEEGEEETDFNENLEEEE